MHLPQGVLCNVHSRYYCTIGLEVYLGLGVCASHVHARFPTHATLDTSKSPADLPLQDFHPLWCPIPGDFEFISLGVKRSELHIPSYSSHKGSVCPLGFSIAFTHPISIDFFSSAYSDVSIQQVTLHIRECYPKVTGCPIR